jgi:hypothetical protein
MTKNTASEAIPVDLSMCLLWSLCLTPAFQNAFDSATVSWTTNILTTKMDSEIAHVNGALSQTKW